MLGWFKFAKTAWCSSGTPEISEVLRGPTKRLRLWKVLHGYFYGNEVAGFRLFLRTEDFGEDESPARPHAPVTAPFSAGANHYAAGESAARTPQR
jgi:hypothetical protein